ncbi:MAG: divalent-cation tolerance protein CutA [Rhodocyclaceae bacterium]|jgi:periplasmic divalent cation tolerance protein|nr:divalent-cation tolerance protein CutA [Rhodocyclaceae bacterium]
MSTGVRLVFTTVPEVALAERLACKLIEAGLAACVKTLPACQSTYRWEGRIAHATEIPLMIVTSAEHYAELESQLRDAHPYDIPEILAVDCSDGLPDYLRWALAAGVDH